MIKKILQYLNQKEYDIKHYIAFDLLKLPEQRPMMNYIRSTGNTNLVGVEIGVYKGKHAISMLRTMDIKMLYLIDPFLNYKDYTDNYGGEKSLENDVMDATIRRLLPYKNKIELIRKFSSEVMSQDVPDNLDFVYIDGNHSYEYVRGDIEMYYPKLKIGGVIGGHDITNGGCPEHDGIIEAVAEFAVKNNLQIYIENPDWWIVKKFNKLGE